MTKPGSLERRTFYSQSILSEVGYVIYLPPGYGSSRQRYPVLYLLHGIWDDETSWTEQGRVHEAAEELIGQGALAKMIIVMPFGAKSFFTNFADGSANWEDYFIRELIPEVDKSFLTEPNRRFRAVDGFSMGGYSALKLAFKFSELFCSVGSLSGPLWDGEILAQCESPPILFLLECIFGRPINAHLWRENNPHELLLTRRPQDLNILITCGDQDGLYPCSEAFHRFLDEHKVDHTFRMERGQHDWDFCRQQVVHSLRFHSNSFQEAYERQKRVAR